MRTHAVDEWTLTTPYRLMALTVRERRTLDLSLCIPFGQFVEPPRHFSNAECALLFDSDVGVTAIGL
jgi:hypothetical protein